MFWHQVLQKRSKSVLHVLRYETFIKVGNVTGARVTGEFSPFYISAPLTLIALQL